MTVRGAQLCFPRAANSGLPLLCGWVRLRTGLGAFSRFGTDFAVVVAVIGVYFLARGVAPDRDGFAVSLTEQLVGFERSLGIF